MLGGANTETNQTPKTINLPDETEGVENPPPSGQAPDEPEQKPEGPGQKPDEHIPPVEVPGRPETPEHVPEKSGSKD